MSAELEHSLEETNRHLAELIERRFRLMWIVLGIGFLLGGLSIALGQINNSHRIHDNRELIGAVRILAQEADTRSQGVSNQNAASRRRLCAESPNQKVACRALFNRLAINITEEQRYRLACDVLFALHTQLADQLRKQAQCPPPVAVRP